MFFDIESLQISVSDLEKVDTDVLVCQAELE